MYPSERYEHLLTNIHEDLREQVKEYVDESYHQGITLKELECRTWREVINALTRYVHSHQYSSRHANLINDFVLYRNL